MTTFALIYETNALTGLPSLRLLEGTAGAISEADLKDLDRELTAKYEQLRRESSSTVHVRSKQYAVENNDPNGSRQPTLIIRPLTTTKGSSSALNGKVTSALQISWVDGFYAEMSKLASDPTVQRLETHAMQAAIEELQAAVPSKSGMLSATLMARYLALSEQLCRGQDQDRAGIYALALRGLGRSLPEPAAEDTTAWRNPQHAGKTEIPPGVARTHWLWRTLSKIIRLQTSE